MVADIARFQEMLTDIKSVLIVLPQEPKVDAIASGLALSLSLRQSGIPTSVSSPSQMIVEANRLVGVDQIREDLGDKNLVVSFPGYPAENIERVSYNIEDGQFALAVIPKPGFEAPKQNQINTSYSGMTADVIMVVGANYPRDLGKTAENKDFQDSINTQKLVLLGNEPLSGWPKAIELIDAGVASISETAYQVIEQLKLPMNEDVATNLFLGIEDGTGSFTAAGVTADTFVKAAELLKMGAQRKTEKQQFVKPQRQKSYPVDMPANFEPKDTNII